MARRIELKTFLNPLKAIRRRASEGHIVVALPLQQQMQMAGKSLLWLRPQHPVATPQTCGSHSYLLRYWL